MYIFKEILNLPECHSYNIIQNVQDTIDVYWVT